MSGREYFVRGRGYLENLGRPRERRDSRRARTGRRCRLRDVGTVRFGGDIRRGLAELDGKGETVGAIVMARYGENALDVIGRVKARARRARPALPPGVEIVPTYDRSSLIERAIETLQRVAHRGGDRRQPR